MVEALRTDYSVRQISETLGFNRSSLYYQPKSDTSDEVLRDEIQRLSARYPKYGYRRITKLLVRMGYTVGYRRVARLMKEDNLLGVSVKGACRTTASLDSKRQWGNRLDNLDIGFRRDQVWVGDITYVRLKGHFVYGVSVLMDVFTRMIRGWQVGSPTPESTSDFETIGTGTTPQRPRDPS